MRPLLAIDRALKLLLRHPRTAFDAHPLRLVVELLLRATFRAVRARAKTPAAARRDVPRRAPRRRLRLAAPRALLVDRARGDLLRLVLRRSALLQRLLDVLVLALPLCRPCLLRHANHLLLEVTRATPTPLRGSGYDSSGWFWTLCSVAYASVSWLTTSMPSL